MIELPDWLWEPQRDSLGRLFDALEPGKRVLFQSPTGSGKTTIAQCLFMWAQEQGLGGNFYVNRKLLIGQSLERFRNAGLDCGVRAAEYDDEFDEDCRFQVSSAQTEDRRVYKSSAWDLHHVGSGGIVVVDEGHLQKSKVMKNLVGWYQTQGARIVIMTATPVNMVAWADKIVVASRIKAWHECGALVPVYTFTVSQPDLAKVKRSPKDGEFVLSADRKKQFIQGIVGEVIQSYEKLSIGGPCFAYCPGVPESAWLAKQLCDRGHRFIHIDASKCIIDGEEKKLDRRQWEDIVGELKDGRAKGLTCRFKAREGIDIPSATHAILATPVGSIMSYLQIAGRIMRASPDTEKTKAILQDHGGNFHRLGSPNSDRDWETLWQLSERAASSLNMDLIRDNKKPEPIRCWKCGMERNGGSRCPHCGCESKQSLRVIRQENGELREVKGDIVHRPRRMRREDTERLWTNMYYGYAKKKVDQSFLQMEAFFFREHGYKPTRDLAFMPRHTVDWYQKVHTVSMERLTGRSKGVITDGKGGDS